MLDYLNLLLDSIFIVFQMDITLYIFLPITITCLGVKILYSLIGRFKDE